MDAKCRASSRAQGELRSVFAAIAVTDFDLSLIRLEPVAAAFRAAHTARGETAKQEQRPGEMEVRHPRGAIAIVRSRRASAHQNAEGYQR